ncbi:hypothetical protein Tsubulata_049300 [Turnera subulata]|uniref:Uncharacterized protein n=1 Tax=Turnera subulata TaxID=218843 RepID=A0A9Q0G7V9_9ROSI|nr:hypothetical protein Tsubulata_049300 [Turnera subulata]
MFYDVPLPLSTQDQLSPLDYGYEFHSMGVVGGEYLCVCFFATDHDQERRRIMFGLWRNTAMKLRGCSLCFIYS